MGNTTVVLYHGNCFDGFGAAYAAWKQFGDQASYIPMQYKQALPEQVDEADTIYMLDYSRKRGEILDLQKQKTVFVVDHHQTAECELSGLPNCTFDMTKSGAVLAWEFFHSKASVPRLLRYIQDRDLWEFKMPDSKEIHAALSIHPFEFEIWDKLVQAFDSPDDFTYWNFYNDFVSQRRAILQYQETLIQKFCSDVYFSTLDTYENIPTVNISMLFSEVPVRLLDL